MYIYISPRFRQLCICLAFRESCFVLIVYCTLSHMLGQLTSYANGQLETIKINKDFLMRLLKRGVLLIYICKLKKKHDN